MSFRQTSNPQVVRAARGAFGFTFQPITPELIGLLTRANSTFIQLVPVAEKYLPKILAARSKLKLKFLTTQMQVQVRLSIRESLNDSAINLFLLTREIKRSEELLTKGRELLLAAALFEFQELAPKDFEQLAKMAGEYFGQWVISDIAKRAAR